MSSEDPQTKPAEAAAPAGTMKLKSALAVFVVATIGLLAATIVLAVNKNNSAASPSVMTSKYPEPDKKVPTIFSQGENFCDGKKLDFANVDCIHLEGPGPQAGANVTKGYKGLMNVTHEPNTQPYYKTGLCPVNVHWHLGTEHYSVGEYDENGDGPHGNIPAPTRRLGDKNVRAGFRCHHYDATDPKFTTEYEWKHCIGMEVGETYEVHWPHSTVGACGHVDQYQTPFYDGVFCNVDMDTVLSLSQQQIADNVGVQGQVFTIVNDESYYYPDMMRGWIVDGEYGKDIAYYTGSTTGTSRNNEICSQYTPITWQVDRKCHMISASSFDKLCYDMKNQRDDMADDLYAHGSRELVADTLVANNQQRKLAHDHHDHDHDHQEWF